jgi:hypothetical protein
MDYLGLVKAVDRLGESVVIAVTDAPYGGSMPASAKLSV